MAWFGARRPGRRRSHAGWTVRATLGFAAPALVAIAVLGEWRALTAAPAAFAPLAARVPRLDPLALLPPIAAGMPLGIGVVLARLWWARRRGRAAPAGIVAPAPLAARSTAELLPAAGTALVAGVTEELAFRLAIPLLAARLTGSAAAGFALATILFVALHRYQRWPGRIGVAAAAAVFAWLYLATGVLWLAMLLHAAIDVMALAVRPWLARFGAPPLRA